MQISRFKEQEIDIYDIDRYWLVFYQLYLDDVIENPPYKDDKDNKVFALLKEERISFIDFSHPDFKTYNERIQQKYLFK